MSMKISVRLSDDVLQAVDEAAEREGRNRSQQVEWVLKQGLAVVGMVDAVGKSAGDAARGAQVRISNWDKPKREAGMCVHGRETKFCVYCQRAAKGKIMNG